MKQYINPKDLSTVVGPYSYGVAAQGDKWLYVSGITGRNSKGEIVEKGDCGKQAEQCILNIKRVVEEGGGNLEDIIKLTIYIKSWDLYEEVIKMRSKYWQPPYPASTTVSVNGFKDEDLLIEIDAVAAI